MITLLFQKVVVLKDAVSPTLCAFDGDDIMQELVLVCRRYRSSCALALQRCMAFLEFSVEASQTLLTKLLSCVVNAFLPGCGVRWRSDHLYDRAKMMHFLVCCRDFCLVASHSG